MKPDPIAVVHIKELKLMAIIGTQPHERECAQEVSMDIQFEYDAGLAAQTDALGHAVDYAAIYASIKERVSATKFFLLERLAAFILEIIMEEPKVLSAMVTLEKSGVLPGTKSVALRMSARRGKNVGETGTLRCY
jgi:FolB domain-containing protein